MIEVMSALGLAVTWALCAWVYWRIHGRRLRWWAVPFALGALLGGRRLERWERR